MSINSALLSGVSGLIANSSALGAISDNIANVNTVGYKRNVTDFQDLVTATATVGAYNSGGVQANVCQLVSQQGQLSQSTSATDLAISGDGFFVVTDKAAGLTSADVRSFTRAGSFTKDSAGYLKNADGMYLQGWLADASGNITTDPSDLTKMSTINVGAIGTVPNPTTTSSLNMNLNAAQTVSAQEATYNPAAAATSMAAYTPTSGTGVKPDYTTQITVYDAKGGPHTFEMDFLKSSTANQWHAEMRAVPATDVAGATNGLISSGIVAFNPDGTLDTTNTTFSTAATAIGASSAGAGVRWATSLGLPAQSVNFNLSGTPASVTQYNSASTTNSTTTDGGPAGTLTGVTVGKDGIVSAAFSNGAVRTIAEVAVATFQNPDGLQSISGDKYRASVASGGFNLKSPGQGGAGEISPSSLEASTVDLSSEFTGLIVTQRAYAASSKIITTADEMLQTLINSKQ
jgi:flagellar hook protein FlgE